MEPFTWALAAKLLLQYGPTAVVYGQKIYENIQAGRANTVVTAADVAEMNRLAGLDAEGIYARLGITPPAASTGPSGIP
jgi:hypothetical protein